MPDKLSRGLLIVLVLGMLYLVYSVNQLEHRVNTLPRSTTVDYSAINRLDPPLGQIQQNQISITAGLHYLELLLEGLVRNDKLPIEQARKAFEARKQRVPAGWTWNDPWETSAPSPVK